MNKILTDICGEIQQAIGESPMKYKVVYDERLQAYKVTEQGNEDSVSFFFSYEKKRRNNSLGELERCRLKQSPDVRCERKIFV